MRVANSKQDPTAHVGGLWDPPFGGERSEPSSSFATSICLCFSHVRTRLSLGFVVWYNEDVCSDDRTFGSLCSKVVMEMNVRPLEHFYFVDLGLCSCRYQLEASSAGPSSVQHY